MLAVPETCSATLFRLHDPHPAREVGAVLHRLVQGGRRHRAALGRRLASDRVQPQADVVSIANRTAADAGAGRRRVDSARLEERAARAVEIRVVAVHLAQVDPGSHHVAELHTRALQQLLGDAEHRERLLVGVVARSAQAGRVEPGFVADVDPQTVRPGGFERFGARSLPVRQDDLPGDLEARLRVQRRLLDLRRGGTVGGAFARCENRAARRADRLEVGPQASEEDRLTDDRRKARALGLEHAEQRAIDRVGLSACVGRRSGRLAEHEELARLGRLHPAHHDPAAVQLDRLGRAEGHCGK